MDSYSTREESRPPADSYRRRSPGSGDRRAARRRSRSPQNIDRYQPDRARDYDQPRRDGNRRRSSPPPMQAGIDRYVPGQDNFAPTFTTNPIPNPMNLEYQVGFNYFAEWWRVEQVMKEEKERAKNGGRKPVLKGEREAREERGKEREQIQAAYDEYKEKLQVQMAKTFVDKHKSDEWFKERYDPEYDVAFKEKLRGYRQGIYADWERQLDEGYFDEFTLEGIYKNDSNGAGGIVEKEEGETTAANEVLGVGDLLPCKGGEIRDESAFQPTLLIKTIAPTVNREKVEEFCKEHLGEGPGGFKWLSMSDPNPLKKCHRIGWVILHPSDEQPMAIDDRGDGRDEDGDEGAIDDSKPEVAQGPLGTAQKALEALNGKTVQDEVRGNFTCHVGIHEPPAAPRKKALWDLFSAPERIERDLELAERLVRKLDYELKEHHEEFGEIDGVSKIEQRVEDLRSKGWLQPPANAPAPIKKERDPEELEEGEDETMEDEEGAYDDEVDDEELLVKKKKLDLLIEYLRRVYNFCFFCVFESDSVHELIRKCAGGHLRRPRASLTTAAKATARATASGEPFPYRKQESAGDAENGEGSPVQERKSLKLSGKNQQQLQRAFNWVKTYEEKLLQLLEPENVDIRKLGGKPLEEAIEDELARYVKQEDESKWRCKVPECTKLFKGQHFWRKHVEKRHPEWLEKLEKDLRLVNSYVVDPAHIAPSRSDANSNGHFPMGNHIQATGTPRGFNLANMNMAMGNNGMQSGLNLQALFNPAMGGNWDPNAVNDDRAGPMRRGGHRFNSRAGPYDRQARDGRNRPNGGNGRLTPPPRGGRPGPQRYGEGGPGPVQSVQGRSIKSYEDLDAVGGGGSGELNY
ncbi:Nn.00g057790.m01.CDS01 [Neocucurbitaria sp. VM-36]